jgi:hypothetical protein
VPPFDSISHVAKTTYGRIPERSTPKYSNNHDKYSKQLDGIPQSGYSIPAMDTPATIREYLFDLGKIVEGALGSDREKVIAYVEQLRNKLEAHGFQEASKRLEQLVRAGQAKSVSFARANGKAAAQDQGRLPVDSESRFPTADVEVLRPGEVQVFLPEEVRSRVGQFLKFVRKSDQLVANGVGVSATMLMFGPPGCGKTHLARYIAAELSLPLVTARTDALISSYLGSTSKNVRALFDHAMSRPCVLFLDEFDALGKMRDDSRELGELKRVVISLLQNIDAMQGDHVLLAATNHEHLLDPAIWRRFAYRINLQLPGAEARSSILADALGSFGDDDLLKILVPVTHGLSGADCREIAEEAVRSALVNDQVTVNQAELLEAALRRREGGAALLEKPIPERVRGLKRILPTEITQKHIGMLVGLSQAQVSKLLKRNSARGRKRTTSN